MQTTHIQHLFWRAGFGITPKALDRISKQSKARIVDDIFKGSKSFTPLQIDLSEFKKIDPRQLIKNPKAIKEFNSKSRERIKTLNFKWVERLMTSDEVLRERMTLFWANHFVCKDNNVVFVHQYNNTLRQYALGNFGDFIKAVSKEPAMIKYLNNKQNRKSKPNENFARELMELFMLGEGNYTEHDIKESARAFTGYNHNFKGDFILRRFQHDYGEKTFLGHTGSFDGDDIIDIILQQKACARFICQKVYRYFVNPKLNKAHIEAMVDVFYPSYNIEQLMRYVFLSDWFYESQNIGVKIKSPIEFIVGLHYVVPYRFKNENDVLKIQRLLGQTLLDPPNVAGWKGDTNWIDANTIMVRLKLPSLLLNNGSISLKGKGDFNDSFRRYYFKHNKDKLPFKTEPDWETFHAYFKNVPIDHLPSYMINGEFNNGTESYMKELAKNSKQDFCIQLMSLPEYQMC